MDDKWRYDYYIMKQQVRLHKFIADSGFCSRRRAEELIAAGRVRVNGQKISRQGVKIDPQKDEVKIDDKKINAQAKKIYIKLNKPVGVVSSCRKYDEQTVLDLVKDIPYRLYPIGRLDKDSEGLILLTNDGEVANRLTHPRYQHEKEYEVNVEFRITNDELRKLSSGIKIDGKMTLPAKVVKMGEKSFRITLKEGKKRQIRRMVEAVRNKVVSLKRTRIKKIHLGELITGKYAFLTSAEIKRLVSA